MPAWRVPALLSSGYISFWTGCRAAGYAVELRNATLFTPEYVDALSAVGAVSLPEWPSPYAAGPRAGRPGSTGTESGGYHPLDAGAPSELPGRKTAIRTV